MPLISIITVCRNEKDTISDTIKSVAAQSFGDTEYIVIDGNSDDGTNEIINQYSDYIDVIISEKDSGVFDAMNKGIQLAKGEYLFFLNSGDRLYRNDTLWEVSKYLDGNELIYGDIIVELDTGSIFRKKSPIKITTDYMIADSIPHQALFTRKSAFQKTGYFKLDLKFTADYEFTLNAIFKEGLSSKYIPVPVSIYNLKGMTANKNNKKAFLDERLKLQRKYFSDNNIDSKIKMKLFIDLKEKYIPGAISLIKSNISSKYLRGDDA